MTEKSFVRVARVADVTRDKSLAVEAGGESLLICHTRDAFFAVVNRCSHAEEKLDCGRVRNGWVSCPIHGARFDLATGKAMNPPAVRPIATYPTRVVDEWIEVEI